MSDIDNRDQLDWSVTGSSGGACHCCTTARILYCFFEEGSLFFDRLLQTLDFLLLFSDSFAKLIQIVRGNRL